MVLISVPQDLELRSESISPDSEFMSPTVFIRLLLGYYQASAYLMPGPILGIGYIKKNKGTSLNQLSFYRKKQYVCMYTQGKHLHI